MTLDRVLYVSRKFRVLSSQLTVTCSAYLQKIKQDHENDKIELAKDMVLLKSLPDKVPKPTIQKPAVPTPVEKPKEQLTWLEHVKKYAADHKLSYRDALKAAKTTYIKKDKTKAVLKKKPKEKKVTEHHCSFCNYKSTDKSNMNRHMKKHTNREKLLKELMSARGLIRRHQVRAESSKNKDVREESQGILKKALETQRVATDALKKIEAGTLKTGTTKKTVTTKKKTTATASKTVPKYFEEVIKRINKSYEENNEEKLGLTRDMITEFKRTGDDIILKVKDLEVDDGEVINSIEMVFDAKMDGYEVALMQEEEIKGEIKSLEYDTFFVY